ncbi:hypothetical protein F2P81_020218 [Scophthalmus maximus]|uniref:Uncharacterized protein n=1 Tax=Scophthalmus maximus TaxID=52904 RepID=A0A6A4S387_SCOMX|nr:hypothetical protein F2P81_020218 [Scophthalmus maximus]
MTALQRRRRAESSMADRGSNEKKNCTKMCLTSICMFSPSFSFGVSTAYCCVKTPSLSERQKPDDDRSDSQEYVPECVYHTEEEADAAYQTHIELCSYFYHNNGNKCMCLRPYIRKTKLDYV